MLKKLLVIMLLILGIISVSFEKNEEIRSYEKGLYDKYEKEYSLKKLMEILFMTIGIKRLIILLRVFFIGKYLNFGRWRVRRG